MGLSSRSQDTINWSLNVFLNLGHWFHLLAMYDEGAWHYAVIRTHL